MRDATERLLQSLGREIEAELDRVINETHQQLEGDFQARLQEALKDAEQETQQLVETRLHETMEARLLDAKMEAREATRVQMTESFDLQLDQTKREVRSQMQAKADEDLKIAESRWAAERLQLQSELDRWRSFAEAQRQLSESTSQTEILYRFLQLSGPFAASLALYVSKDDKLSLWQSRGEMFPATAPVEHQDSEHYRKPIAVREKTVGVVSAKLPCDSAALDFLVSCLERTIETFGMRMRTASPRAPVPQPANGGHV